MSRVHVAVQTSGGRAADDAVPRNRTSDGRARRRANGGHDRGDERPTNGGHDRGDERPTNGGHGGVGGGAVDGGHGGVGGGGVDEGAVGGGVGGAGVEGARAGLREAVLFEWTKLRSARSLWGTLLAGAALPPVFAVIVAATGSLQPHDTILGASLTGVAGAQLAAIFLGALVLTTEHTTRTLASTFTVSPRRGTVVAAKAAVVGALTFAVTLVSATGAFLVGRAMLDGDRYATGEPFPALLGVALCVALTSLLGLAVGTLLRHSAGAVAAGAGLLLLPSFLGPFFGDGQRWVAGASPLAALEKLTQTSDATHDAVGRLGGWASLLLVAALALGALALSARRLLARDL